jgi:hypothetical protein
MKNHNSPLLHSLHGKTIKSHHVSGSHGEVLHIYFTDGTEMAISSTYGLMDSSIKPDVNDIYVSVNEQAV